MSVESDVDATASLLASWGLPADVVNTFNDQQVTLTTFQYLTPDVILQLIPALGPRITFIAKREQHLKNAGSFSTPVITATTSSNTGATAATTSLDTGASAATTSSDTGATAATTSLNTGASATTSAVASSRGSKRSAGRSFLSSYKNSIDKLLDTTLEGQLVLAAFNKLEKLDNSLRDQLVKCVIFHLFKDNYNTRVDSSTWERLSCEIVEVFPTECKETYYFTYKKNKKTIVGGRLVVKYHNLRRKLISVGLIDKSSVEEELCIEEGLDYGLDLNIEEDEDFRWLSTNIRPWPSVLAAWDRTRPTRMSLLKGIKLTKHVLNDGVDDLESQISDVPSYLEYFKALSTPNGWELLCDDFNNIYPNQHLTLNSQWERILVFARSKLGIRGSKFLDDNKTSADQKQVELLIHFADLFKVRNVPLPNNKSWKVSKAEVQRSFVLHAETEGAWKSAVHDRREQLAAQSLTLQPYIVFLGPLSAIRKIRLVITAKSTWDFDSPIQAVDAAFKSFFACHTSYPPECRHIWLFLQQAVYGIETKSDYTGDPTLKGFLSSDRKEFSSIKS